MTFLNKRREWAEIKEIVASEYSEAATESFKIRHWLEMTAWWLHLATGFRQRDLLYAGIFASYKAIKDGEISGPDISDGAKRYIRREMIRESAPASKPYYQQLIDYGYEDGRTLQRGRISLLDNKYIRYYHNCRAKGLCPRCGKTPESDYVLCNHCRLVKRRSYQRQAEKYCTAKIRAKRKSIWIHELELRHQFEE